MQGRDPARGPGTTIVRDTGTLTILTRRRARESPLGEAAASGHLDDEHADRTREVTAELTSVPSGRTDTDLEHD